MRCHVWSRRALLVATVSLFMVSLMLGVGLAAQKPRTGSEFDRATAGMNRSAVADYVFKTYGCHGCHIAMANGGTGFTARGNEAREGFVGCVRLLTDVGRTLESDPKNWTADEQRTRQHFQEFGCTFCHAPAAGKMAFTDVGRRLGTLHLGCVQVAEEVVK